MITDSNLVANKSIKKKIFAFVAFVSIPGKVGTH